MFSTCERFRKKTRFDTEPKGNSKMSYCTHNLAKARWRGRELSVVFLLFFPLGGREGGLFLPGSCDDKFTYCCICHEFKKTRIRLSV